MTFEQLKTLGGRLREERLKRNESQQTFAARIGVSIPTLRKMESGDDGATIGHWVMALFILDRLDDLDCVLAETEDLFAKYERLMQRHKRKRASAKKPQPEPIDLTESRKAGDKIAHELNEYFRKQESLKE